MKGFSRKGTVSSIPAPLSPASVSTASRASRLLSPAVAGTASAQRPNTPRATNVLPPAFHTFARTRPQAVPLPHQPSSGKAHPLQLMSPSGAGGQIPLSPPALDLSLYSHANTENIERYSPTAVPAGKRERRLLLGIFPDPEDCKPRDYVRLIATCAAAICMLLLLVESTSSAYFQHCDNPVSCFDLDTELQRSRHVDVDPCRNMFGHVCGRWTSMYPGRQDQFELLNQRLIMSLLENVGQVSTGSGSATDKAGAALFGCMRVAEDMVDDISAIREVLNRHGLHLPAQDIRPSRDVFRILVGLTLQDLLGVFFQLKPSPYLRTDDRFVFELRYAETMYRYVSNEKAIENCVRSYDPDLEDVSTLAMTLTNVENDVAVVTMLYPPREPEHRYLTVQEIEKYYYDSTGHEAIIKTQWWVEDINQNVPKQSAISPQSEILLSDKHALFLTDALLRAYTSRSLPLQSYIAWKVIKYLSHAASSRMVHCHILSSQEHMAYAFPIDLSRCIEYATQVIPYGLLSLQLKNILQDETINYANTVSKRVRQQIEMSYNLSMLDPQSAKSIMQRLRSIHQIVGTASKLRSDEALNSYYRHIPMYDAKVNFVKWLVKAHRAEAAHKILFLHPSPDIATSINRDDWEPTSISVGAFYVILYHLIYLPGGTLVSPLLVRNGPNSYNYGAIGKVIGHELSHAFEPRFLEVTTRGDAQAFYTPRFRKLLEGQQDCLILQANKMTESAIAGNNSISETYADTAGLEAAYLAYSTLPLTDRRMGVGPYTADQAFFVGSCYMLCEAERTPSERSVYLPHRVRCNQPCINTQEFADAYRCSKGSAMFPRSRCDIHDHRLINPSEAR
ncbi:neprilysin-1-like [Amblyomma americanum]